MINIIKKRIFTRIFLIFRIKLINKLKKSNWKINNYNAVYVIKKKQMNQES